MPRSDFTVIGGHLQFTDDLDKAHTIGLSDCEVVRVKNVRKGQAYVFRINLPSGTRLGRLKERLVLAADSETDRLRWVNALQNAGASTADFFASSDAIPRERGTSTMGGVM